MVKLLALVALLAGCEASLGPGTGETNGVDAAGGGGGGSNIDAAVQQQVDAAPACANGRKLYLNFDGVTITQAATSDSTTNAAKWLTNASAAVPAWRSGSGTRATEITEVVDGVRARLSMTDIEVVTARPSTTPYVMIVFGGARTSSGGTVGTIYSFGTSFHDCGDTVKNDLGWVSDMPGQTTELVADIVVGAVGWGIGLDGTTDTADCMCGWASTCTNAAGACTLSSNIATAISSSSETACPNQNPQNEIQAFAKFCE
jgi:hypothetical protein